MYEKIKNAASNVADETVMKASICPQITICGKMIEIENYKKVYKASKEEMLILFARKIDDVKITGKDLNIVKINKYEVCIKGKIENMSYVNRASGDKNV